MEKLHFPNIVRRSPRKKHLEIIYTYAHYRGFVATQKLLGSHLAFLLLQVIDLGAIHMFSPKFFL